MTSAQAPSEDLYRSPIRTGTSISLNAPLDEPNYYFQTKTPAASTLVKLMAKVHSKSSFTNSQLVHDKLGKLLRAEKKTTRLQEDLIREINLWGDLVPNEDSKIILNEFGHCLELQRLIEEELIQRQESLKLQLAAVQKRESKANELRFKRDKLYRILRERESKTGETPSISLTKENLEELNVSLEVVGEQYIRSINSNLKSSIMNYMSSISLMTSKLKSGVDHYYTTLALVPPASTPKRITYSQNPQIVRDQLNSGSIISADGNNETPQLLNSSNQKIFTPGASSSGNYIKVLKNQLLQRQAQASRATENGFGRNICFDCNRPGHQCQRHNENTTKKANPIVFHDDKIPGQENDTVQAGNAAKRKTSGNFPGGLGVRFPSSLVNMDQWRQN